MAPVKDAYLAGVTTGAGVRSDGNCPATLVYIVGAHSRAHSAGVRKDSEMSNADEMDDFNGPWPTPGDKAFVETHLLRGGAAAHDIGERLHRMIRGYRLAGDILVERAEQEPHLRQNLLYPIVLNYRHSLELQMKFLLSAYGHVAGEAQEWANHSLEKLWPRCRRIIEHAVSSEENEDPAIIAVESLIDEFAKNDPKSENFRYPTGRDGQQIDIRFGSIDLAALRCAVAKIREFLECVHLELRYGQGIEPARWMRQA